VNEGPAAGHQDEKSGRPNQSGSPDKSVAPKDAIKTIRPLKRIAVSAAKFEFLAYGASMALKFFSSLVLSRLLFPEAFGLAVTVGLVSIGLTMLSNVGVTQSIIQSPNGDKLEFLNTGWSVLVLRGATLWIIAVILAYPIAKLLDEPQLALLLPVSCLGVLISGFSSTSLITLRRHLHVKPLLLLEVSTQIITFIFSVWLAWTLKSVWGLVIASLVGVSFSTVVSHLLKVDYKNRFQWHKPSWREMYQYGRWIQASSAVSFLSSQADRFLLAHYIGMATLGVYNFAVILAEAISAAVVRLTHEVLFPVFSQMSRDEPARLADAYYRIRVRVDVMTLLPLGVIAASSQQIVDLLFDDRYAAAGWMLQALCVRAAMTCLLAPVETYLFAVGQTRYGFYRDLARAFWVLPGIPLAWTFGDVHSVIWVIALSELGPMIVLWFGFHRLGYMRWRYEIVGPAMFILGMAIATLVWRELTV